MFTLGNVVISSEAKNRIPGHADELTEGNIILLA